MCGELLLPPKPPAPMMKMANWLVHTSSPLSVFVSTARTRVASQSKSSNCSYDLTPTISKDQSSRLLVHHVHHFTLRVECTWQRKQWLICTCNSPTYRTRVQDKGTRQGYKYEGTGRGYRTRVQDKGTGQKYRTRVQDEGTNIGYRTRVQDKGTGQGYRTRVQDKGTGRGYRTRIQI